MSWQRNLRQCAATLGTNAAIVKTLDSHTWEHGFRHGLCFASIQTLRLFKPYCSRLFLLELGSVIRESYAKPYLILIRCEKCGEVYGTEQSADKVFSKVRDFCSPCRCRWLEIAAATCAEVAR